MVKDYKIKICLLDEMEVPTNNISLKVYNEMTKYKDWEIEIEKNVAPPYQ